MKKLHRTCVALALASIWTVANAAPPSNSPYYTDVQTQYPKDKAQDTFQMASFLACFMKAMAPERSVGVGEYLAYVDESKCEDNGATANTTSSSGGSSVAPPDYAKVLVSVTEGTAGELVVEAKVKLSDEEGGVEIPKHILARGVIYSGPNLTPPYGDWRMDFCSSTAGNAGSCNDGIGFSRVNGTGISIYNSNGGSNYRAGKSVFSTPGGSTGYGKVAVNEPQWNEYANKTFAFAPGIYALKDRLTNSEACYNPSTSASGVKFNSWDTFLYDQSTGQRVTYQNPGFQLKSALTGYTVGSVDYWGVNFWNEANAADQLAGAVLIKVGDDSKTFTLKKTPGRLNKVAVSSSTGLSPIDGVPLNFGVWGWDGTNNRGFGTKELLQDIGVSVSSNSLNLIGYWSQSAASFSITGYQSCGSSGCSIQNLNATASRSIDQLLALGVENVNAWVNGINVNYNFNLRKWVGGSYVTYDANSVKLIKQTSEIVMPTDGTIPNLICVGGNCPSANGSGQLVDVANVNWPSLAADVSYLTWDATQGGPKVTGRGSTTYSTPILVDWRSSSNPNNGHYYQLYDQNNLTDMTCGRWSGGGYVNDGICPDKIRDLDNATFYTWQSGNRWDANDYLVYLTGGTAGEAVQVGKPLNLSYEVASTQGTLPGLVGKTIAIQSPRPGTLWLPGNCIDDNFAEAECSKNTQWVNTVVIPFAANDSGSVTLLDSTTNQPTSTKYYVKWLQRGVYFEQLPQSTCNGLSGQVALGENIDLPGLADFNTAVRSISWPSSGFDGVPRVIDGVLQ